MLHAVNGVLVMFKGSYLQTANVWLMIPCQLSLSGTVQPCTPSMAVMAMKGVSPFWSAAPAVVGLAACYYLMYLLVQDCGAQREKQLGGGSR